MKNIRNLGWALAALFFFVGASIWEGAAAVSAGGDLPERGYYAATNSFPRNTIVDVTNLETGKTVRVIVAGTLDTPGLLAILSRDAASDIGLQSRSIGRIRMTQPTDPIAFSRFTEGLGSSGDPDYDPQAFISANTNVSPTVQAQDRGISPEPEAAWVVQEPDNPAIDTPPVYPPADQGRAVTISEEPKNNLPGPVTAQPYPYTDGEYDLTLVPSEARPPTESLRSLPAEAEIPPLSSSSVTPQTSPERTPDPAYFVPPIGTTSAAQSQPVRETVPFPPAPPVPAQGAATGTPSFSVPLITNLEKGKYYLQLGAFSKTEAIESEISKIGRTYPLAIQRGGTSDRPVYRILLGPVNLGESSALLERFKRTGYTDAFVRSGGM